MTAEAEAVHDLTAGANVLLSTRTLASRRPSSAAAVGGLDGWILDRLVSVGAAVDSCVCLHCKPRCGGTEELSTAFDSGVLSSENMGQRYKISIWVSEAQPAIWIKSGVISAYTMGQTLNWTLDESQCVQNAVDVYMCIYSV